MSPREVSLATREGDLEEARTRLDQASAEYVEARVRRDPARLAAADASLDAAVADYRRARSKLEKTVRRLLKRCGAIDQTTAS